MEWRYYVGNRDLLEVRHSSALLEFFCISMILVHENKFPLRLLVTVINMEIVSFFHFFFLLTVHRSQDRISQENCHINLHTREEGEWGTSKRERDILHSHMPHSATCQGRRRFFFKLNKGLNIHGKGY